VQCMTSTPLASRRSLEQIKSMSELVSMDYLNDTHMEIYAIMLHACIRGLQLVGGGRRAAVDLLGHHLIVRILKREFTDYGALIGCCARCVLR
jgi:hypothetical protein